MLREFCVLQKQQKVSGQMLQKLWNQEGFEETREVVETCVEVSRVQMTYEIECVIIDLRGMVLDTAMQNDSKEKQSAVMI